MDESINKEIINQRMQLEKLIERNNNLQNADVINCSRKLDMLIIKYFKNKINAFNEIDNIEQIAQLSFLFKAKKDNSKAKHNNACG